jgi:hypothetical protein
VYATRRAIKKGYPGVITKNPLSFRRRSGKTKGVVFIALYQNDKIKTRLVYTAGESVLGKTIQSLSTLRLEDKNREGVRLYYPHFKN